MRLQRDVAMAIVCQGFGAASVALGMVYIGGQCGPVVQGGFSLLRSEIEFISTASILGIPQAAFFYLRKGEVQMAVLARAVLLVVILAPAFAMMYSILTDRNAYDYVSVGISAAICTIHSCLRVVVLAKCNPIAFSMCTLFPQILIAMTAVIIAVAGQPQGATLAAAFGGIFLGAIIFDVVLLMANRTDDCPRPHANVASLGKIVAYGLPIWGSIAVSMLSSILIQRCVEHKIGPASLGVIAMAMMVISTAAMPFAYAAPLMFKHYLANAGRGTKLAGASSGAATAAVVFVAIELLRMRGNFFGEYTQITGWSIPIAVAAGSQVATIISSTHALSRSHPRLPLISELLRFTCLLPVFFHESIELSGVILNMAIAYLISYAPYLFDFNRKEQVNS